MKKYTIITFVLAFALLSACKGDSDDEPAPSATSTGTWTVSFNLDGGTVDGANTLADVTVTKGSSLGAALKTPTRDGSWSFGGWFDESVNPYVEYQSTTPITKNLTLKAKWTSTDTNKWVVSFDTDGGTPSSIESIQVDKGQSMGDQYPTPDPTKERYAFEGWYLATDTTFSDTKYEKNTPAITNDTDLKAKWKSTDITIEIDMVGYEDDDSVTPSPSSGQVGDEISISYTLANIKDNNRLVFSGTTPAIEEVDVAGTGTKTYTIVATDATDGVITIIATFTHSDKTLDTIAFDDNVGVDKIYGDASYAKAITTTGTGTGAISYESSDPTVATVNSSTGEVTILKVGTTTITATKAEDDNYSGDTASYLLTVEPLQLTIGTPQITPKVYDGNATATVTPGVLTNKVGSDAVTVSAIGTFASVNVGDSISVTVVYSINGGADADNYTAPEAGTATGSITKATGRTIAAAPTLASRTQNSITLNAATISAPEYGQSAEYTFSSTISTVAGLTGSEVWQDWLTFNGLDAGTSYYFFARAKENSNCETGAAQVSAAMKTAGVTNPERKAVVDFENVAIGTTYNTAAIKVAADPVYSGERSLQSTINNYGQYAVVPVNLPYELQNYQSFSFRFSLVGGSSLDNKDLIVYAASANAINTTSANQLGHTGNVNFNDTFKNKWTDYTFSIASPNVAIATLKGVIYLTIGMNHNNIDFMIDDLIFTLKDDFDPPATISPTTATFDISDPEDIEVTITFQGKTLSSIANGGTNLTSGTDYTTNGNVVTLKSSYLSTQAVGTTTLTFNFSAGTPSTIAIEIKDSSVASPLLIKYDFSNGDTIAAGYPKAVTGTITGTILEIGDGAGNPSGALAVTARVLRVIKTGNYNGESTISLPFDVGTGKLSDYNRIRLVMRGTPSAGGDLSNKNWVVKGIQGANTGNIATSSFSLNTTTVTTYTWNITSGTWDNWTGNIDIGLNLPNISAYSYEITSIELVKVGAP